MYWEGQIHTVIRAQILTDEAGGALMFEVTVEAIIDGRPCARTSEKPSDIEALTHPKKFATNEKKACIAGLSTSKEQYLNRRGSNTIFGRYIVVLVVKRN